MIELNYLLIYITTFFGLFTSIYFFITLYENHDKILSPKATRFPGVTIIVPDYGHPESLKVTIESLLGLNYPKGKLKIFVVINGIDSFAKMQAFKLAKSYEDKGIETFYAGNVGKGGAINRGIKQTTTEFVGALDADCYCDKNALRRMVAYFENPNVMAVTPSIQISNAKSFLQRLQKIEFMVGVFLRRVFGFLGSIHITPGPFTIYRKAFFDKYGAYDESTITEDIEIALRIQQKNYVIENATDSLVYTSGVKEFWPLFNQRIRWYRGFIDNVVKYKVLFGAKTGNLGLFILPASFFSIGLTSLLIILSLINAMDNGIKFFLNWKAVNFSIWKLFELKFDLFFISTNSLIIFTLISLILGLIILHISKDMAQEKETIKLSFLFHFLFYWFLFVMWWGVATFYYLTGKKIKWGPREG
ncbi:glycosyltransferase family 2 protein [Candidatus Woesearchaeota archaeon]|nr:glycosyltransferase family 2 protein [Candidatus Woesearchaeota archaeon]